MHADGITDERKQRRKKGRSYWREDRARTLKANRKAGRPFVTDGHILELRRKNGLVCVPPDPVQDLPETV